MWKQLMAKKNMLQVLRTIIHPLPLAIVTLSLSLIGEVLGQTVRQTFSDDGKLILSQNIEKKEELLPEPLLDDEIQLIALAPDRSIFLAVDRKSTDQKSVVFLADVCLREGPLEFFACTKNTKEHESILATRAKPSLIHVGLLATGAETGTPVQFTPKFVPATGPRIDITIRWLGNDGKRQEAKAEEWIQEMKSKKQMDTYWVFSGSLFQRLESGKNQYLADVTGEIIGVSNFPTVVLDVPIASTSNNEELFFQAFTEKIPPEGTKVTVILSRFEK